MLSGFSAFAANPDGDLRIEVSAGANFVVDSNVESPSTYAPRSAYIGATFYNDGTTDMTNVFVNIGDFAAGTPGIYPSRAHMSLVGPLPGDEFALTHEGGSAGTADAVRYIGTIPAGESVTVYWLVSYPNLDENGDAVWGPSVKPDDDLWLEYDIWATATSEGTPLTADVTRKVTMRNEISASANKIWPNVIHDVPMEYQDLYGVYQPMWTNLTLVGTPGVSMITEGYWFNLGNVSGGFDNDGDLVPDGNAWLQPVGDPTIFDSSAFRLVHTYALIIVNGGEYVYHLEDDLYLDNLPENNSVVGMVRYEFMPLMSGAASVLTPYQEAASGNDNEKFNGDYGTTVTLPPPLQSEVEMEKTVDKATAWPGDPLWYKVDFTNSGEIAVGSPLLYTPLVVQDSIPAGTYYVAGSAAISNTLPSGVSAYTVLYSTNNGTSWTETEPAVATNVTDLQWWLSDALPVAAAGTVTFSVKVDNPYNEPDYVVLNVAGLSFGNTAPFLEDDAVTLILGLNYLGDTVFLDNGSGGGITGNGIQDGTEPGISNITVNLYFDVDEDGILDATDVLLGSVASGVNGLYSYTNLPDGMFLVQVDDEDPDLPYGSAVTRPTLVSVDLDAASTNSSASCNLNADFGFVPVMNLTKSIIGSSTNREGDLVSYNITVTNRIVGNSGYQVYDTWAKGEIVNAKTWTDTTNAYMPPGPDGKYASDTLENVANLLSLTNFNLGMTPAGTVSNVTMMISCVATGTFVGGDTLQVDLMNGATTIFTTNIDANAISSNIFDGELRFNITTNRAWTWNWFNSTNLVIQLTGKKAGTPDAGTVFVDAVGFRITSSWISSTNDPSKTLDPVPLIDTFDADKMTFVSANPSPQSVLTNGSAPDSIGTITWDNVGPLYPGGYKTVSSTFRMLEPPPDNTQATNTNTVVVSNAFYADGRPANSATASVVNVVLPAGTIGDFVWRDLDHDGVQDGGAESGIANVSVRLTPPAGVNLGNGAGQPVTNVTDSTGYYLFRGLPADGTYTVAVVTTTLPGGSGTCTYDEDSGTNSPNSQTAVILDFDAHDGTDTHLTADFGYTIGTTIDGTVWNDINRNGASMPDSGEPWLTNVTVYLFSGTVPGLPASAIATNKTSTNGYFVFTGPYSGDYCVQVVTNTGSMGTNVWTRSFDTDGIGTANYVVTNVVSGGYGRADYSYYRTGPYSIGDTVFYDWDGDYVQDANDEGVRNVNVFLYIDRNTNGIVDVGIDPLMFTDVTDTNGMYLFEGLIPTNYIVVLDQTDPDMPPLYHITGDPEGPNDGISRVVITNASRLDQDFAIMPYGYGMIGDTVWKDYYGDGIQSGVNEPGISNITVTLWTDWDSNGVYVVQSTFSTITNGWYGFLAFPDGNYLVRVDTNDVDLPIDSFGNKYFPTTPIEFYVSITNGSSYLDADFGFTALGAIGDTIFWDSNRDGEQDINESGISGVTVKLYVDNNSDGYYDGGDTFYGSQVTTNKGFYVFSGLLPGDYVVVVDTNSAPIVGTLLAADPSCNGIYAQDPGAIDADSEYGVSLELGERFYGADFGYVPNGIIGDTIWLDVNNDGIRDGNESGIPYVTLNLYTNGSLVATTETDSGGWYSFSGIFDGTYTVIVDTNDTDFLPGRVRTYDADGTLDDQAVDIVILDGHMVTVGGSSFTNELGIDFGYRYVGSNTLSGTIGLDAIPYDGVMGTGNYGVSSNEVPFPDETVYLYLWNDDGDNIPETGEYVYQSSTITSNNGDYSFFDLPDGDGNDDYLVSYSPLIENIMLTTTNGSTPATIVSNRVDASGYTISAWQAVPVALVITNIDFAFYSSITYDFGDLPASYGTMLQDDGARHMVKAIPDLYLGPTIDTENTGIPSVGADSDGADEDGVSLAGMWTEGANGGHVEVNVGAGSGWLVGYIDFNNDGDFSDAGEMVVSAAVSTNGGGGTGTYAIDFTVPSGVISATNVSSFYARFRLFGSEPNYPAYEGVAANGEVEDYLFELGALGDYVWKDENGDGVQDAGEPPLVNVRVFADVNDDGIYQATEPSAVTGTNGLYNIGGFVSGTYNIRVDASTLPATLWPSYDLDGTNTPHVASVTMTDGQIRTDVDFGYYAGEIDVGVYKSVDDAAPAVGSNIVYTIIVTNFGPIVATELEFTDNLPAGVKYVTNTTSTGTYENVSGIWSIDMLEVDAVATMTITAIVDTNTADKAITNWVYLTHIYQDDTNPTNNQDYAVITPTVVVLNRFEALNVDGQVVVEWETSSELGTVGFYLMRKEQDKFIKVNAELLPAVPGTPQGGIYRVIDTEAKTGELYTYVLVEMEITGAQNEYGPFDVAAPESKGVGKKISDWLKRAFSDKEQNGTRAGLDNKDARTMDFGNMNASAKRSLGKERRMERKRGLALGHAKQADKPGHPHYVDDSPVLKITVEEAGVVSVDAAQFIEVTGADTNEVLEAFLAHGLELTCNGVKVPHLINPQGTGLSFYAQKIDSKYTDNNVFILRYGHGLEMAVLEGEGPDLGEPATYMEDAHFEQEIYSVGALIPDPDADHWMWSFFVGGNAVYGKQSYTLASPGAAVESSQEGTLVVRMQGGSSTGVAGEHIVTVVINGVTAGSGSWSGTTAFDLVVPLPGGLLVDGDNRVQLIATKAAKAAYSVTYLNEFDLTYPRKLEADGDLALLKDTAAGVITLGGFVTASPSVWDINEPDLPVVLNGVNHSIEGKVSFNAEESHDYVIFGEQGVLQTPPMEALQLNVLKSKTNAADYVIITVPELSEGAQKLADYRGGLGLKVITVMLEDIYNEFSYGIVTPQAVKDFLSYACEKWKVKPAYVVLTGEGTYDYKGTMGTEDNLVPPMLITTPWGLFASDNWFVDFDNDLVPELPLGRLPVMTNEELADMVDKIIAYESVAAGDWQKNMLMAADNRDSGGNFAGSSDQLAGHVPVTYNIMKAYLDNGTIAETRASLISGFNRGSAFMSYFGHAGLDRMANEGLLTTADVELLTNGGRQPVLLGMSCMMGRFALPGYDCLAEELLLKKNGGVVAVWTPTGMALNTLSRVLAEEFYTAVFKGGEGVLGDAMITAIRGYAACSNARDPLSVYGLLGDPAMRFTGRPYTAYSVELSSFERWKEKWNSSSKPGDKLLNGPDAEPDGDADGDGVSNIREYAFGLNPLMKDSKPGLRLGQKDDKEDPAKPSKPFDMEVVFERNKYAQGAEFVVETSEDLVTWRNDGYHISEIIVTDNENGLTETVTVRIKVNGSKGCFARLRLDISSQ